MPNSENILPTWVTCEENYNVVEVHYQDAEEFFYMEEWLRKNCEGRYEIRCSSRFDSKNGFPIDTLFFEFPMDAVTFKMRWG